MPDFSAAFTSGVTVAEWTDPDRPAGTNGADDKGAPSRINPEVGLPHLRQVSTAGVEVELTATVDGVAGPLDAALDGRLFEAHLHEWVGARPIPTSPAGQSSVQRFTPMAAGHYLVKLSRPEGGAFFMHLDVQ